jgi:hypothetical protein
VPSVTISATSKTEENCSLSSFAPNTTSNKTTEIAEANIEMMRQPRSGAVLK